MKDRVIQLRDIHKSYAINHERPIFIDRLLTKKREIFWAQKKINLTIYRGEKVGIIGKNGSGKTTLLKIIAGITTPTSGKLTTTGSIISIIDIGAGFHPDLTGLQNIILNGLLLGARKSYIESQLANIVRYAGIRQFIDVPLYTYSAGMKLRLGFAVAIHCNPDILLLDEGLSFGDSQFTKKARETLNSVEFQKKTILTVYHDPILLCKQCSRGIVLRDGHIAYDGKTTSIRDRNVLISNI